MDPRLSEQPPEAPPPRPVATNTLVLTNLPPAAFDRSGQAVLDMLAATYGRIARLVVLKSFGRMFAVFSDTQVAIKAKTELHKTPFLNQELRVYYGQHTDLNHLDPEAGMRLNRLQIPETERNFLLSPPGSPPVGWLQTQETAPAEGGHSEALLEHAMSALSLAGFKLDGGEEVELGDGNGDGVDYGVDSRHAHSSEESTTSDGRRIEVLRFGAAAMISAAGTNTQEIHSNGLGLGYAAASTSIVATDGDVEALPIIMIESMMPAGEDDGGDDDDGQTRITRTRTRTPMPPPMPRTQAPPPLHSVER